MTFLPIVVRELRLQARRPRTYYLRCAVTAAAMLVGFGIVSLSLSAGRDPTRIGQDLYWASSLLAFGFSLLAGPVAAADCVSEEKRDGTLGLLFLTDLKGYDVVLGKLVNTSLPSFYALSAAIPILAIPFFLGGVTAGEFWRMTAVLLTTLGFSLCASLFASAISRDGRRAFVAAAAAVLVLALAPGLVLAGVVRPNSVPALALSAMPSPGILFYGVTDGRYAAAPARFWYALFELHLLSVLLLALAGLLLPRCWQESGAGNRPGHGLPRIWRDRWIARWSRRHRARRKLDINPMFWLAERTTLNPWATHLFWVTGFAVWVGGFTALRGRFVPAPLVFAFVYLLHVVLKCWVAWEASRRFAEDRRTGAMELLLTTPLNERTLLVGWLLGLKRRFLAPVLALFAIDAHLWWSGDSGDWMLGMLAAVGLFVADTYTLCWVGLWMGLTSKSSSRAFRSTIGRVLVLPWFIFLAIAGIGGLLAQGGGLPLGPSWLGVIWFVGSYMFDVALCAWGINKLSDDFRIAAADQVEPLPGRKAPTTREKEAPNAGAVPQSGTSNRRSHDSPTRGVRVGV